MAWRNAQASMVLVAEINRRWPNRDKSSDGTIGDAAHAARTSDHNPWLVKGGQGVVRARDVDKDGIDAAWIVEHLRKLGAMRDPRLWPAGYIIFNRRITKPDFSGWKTYTGSNPHDKHFHVSFSTDTSARGFDSTSGWGIASADTTVTPPAGVPVTREETDVLVQAPIYWDANRNFRTTCKAEAGAGSVFSGGWAFVSATWGALTDVRVFAHDGKGRTWGPYSPAGGTVQNNTEFVQALPVGTRYFTAEGRAANQSSIATVSAICKPA